MYAFFMLIFSLISSLAVHRKEEGYIDNDLDSKQKHANSYCRDLSCICGQHMQLHFYQVS